jgi:hypothetical protein
VSSRAAAVAAVAVPSRSSALFGKRSIVDELKDIDESADGSSDGDDAAASAQKAKKEKVSALCWLLCISAHGVALQTLQCLCPL